jgi:hypothetical protein
MPPITAFDATNLDDLGIVQVLDTCISNFSETLSEMLDVIGQLVACNKPENEALAKEVDIKASIETLGKELSAVKNASDTIEKALQIFNKGRAVFFYTGLKKLKQNHIKLFSGLDINPNTIKLCLAGLKFIEECSPIHIIFSKDLDFHFKVKKELSTSLGLELAYSIMARITADYEQCTNNLITFIKLATTRLVYAACHYIYPSPIKMRIYSLNYQKEC